MHLDALLGRGSSRTVRDQVVALSHEYHIVTPYTSLLVLETDADRERFGVQHLLGVPEGERFFGRRRAEASWGLVEQQRKQSRAWRLGPPRRSAGAASRTEPGRGGLPSDRG